MKISENLYAYLWESMVENNCNSYIIDGKVKTLVDPGHHHLFNQLESSMREDGFSPDDIHLVIITHPHPDHCEAVQNFLNFDTKIAIHEDAENFLESYGEQFYRIMGLSVPPWRVDILLREGELRLGEYTFDVIYTPGHAPGSICLYWREKRALFTGDVVFNQSIGRVDLPGGNGEELKKSVQKIAQLDAELVLPGHGPIVSGRGAIKQNFYSIMNMVTNWL